MTVTELYLVLGLWPKVEHAIHYVVPSTTSASKMSERAGIQSNLFTGKTIYFRNFVPVG